MPLNKLPYISLLVLAGFVTLSVPVTAVPQSGGQFTLQQSVIANGGGASTGGSFSLAGTSSQSAAGTRATNSGLGLHGGFWQGSPLAPTAATVSIGGRVLNADGQGIRNIMVVMTNTAGENRMCLTSSFGYYRFDETLTGQNVILSISSKRFTFAEPSMLVAVGDDNAEVNFVAN